MFNIHRVQLDWGGRTLTLETGKIARQADGAVLATYGETTVLAAVVAAKQPKEGIDFLPLTVNYTEKYYAAGRIPGGYFKREARADRKGYADVAPDRPPDPSAVRRRLALRHAGDRHRALARSGERSRHRGDGRLVRRAHAVGRSLHGADRRRARRLHQQRIRAQPANRRDDREPARSRRRRHARRRDDGGVGSQGAVRGDHARRRDVRPSALPAGDRRDHQTRREGREGTSRAGRCRQRGHRKGNSRPRRAGPARGLLDRAQAGAPGCGRGGQEEGDGALLPRRRRTEVRQAGRLPACSRNSKPRSFAGTSSIPASASTAAT